MLSLNFIRDNRDTVEKAIADKKVKLDLAQLLALDGEVRLMKSEIDELRRQRNEISAGFKSADPPGRPALGARGRGGGARGSARVTSCGGSATRSAPASRAPTPRSAPRSGPGRRRWARGP